MPTKVIHQAGPLPIKTSIPWPTSDAVIVAVSGSAWSNTPNATIAVNVLVNGQQIGTLQHFANPASTHLAFPAGFFETTQSFGNIPVALAPATANTITDQNDMFTVTLIY